MKNFTIIYLLLLCSQVNAQLYYYNGNKKVTLYESKNSFITYEQLSHEVLSNFSKTEGSDLSEFTILDELKSSKSISIQKVTSGQTAPALLLEEAGNFKMYPTKSIRVKMKPGITKDDIMDLITVSRIEAYELRFGILEIKMKNIHTTINLANKIYESGLADFSTPDFHIPIIRNQQAVQDPLFPLQFQMNNTGQIIDGIVGVNDMDCNALEAWDLALGNNVVVAVIDDGLEAHEDLGNRLIGGFTPLNNGDGSPVNDLDNHGMSCAGIIGSSHNTLGVRGLAPNVDFLGVNIFASNTPTNGDVADGIRWAVDNGADVINNSWSFPFAPCDFTDPDIEDALQHAANNGVVVIFSSGNQGDCVEYPATNPNVIAVGAFNNRGFLYNYSATGPELDLTAPSGLRFGDVGIRTMDRMDSAGSTNENYRNDFDGTSAAAPAALVLSANPNLTPLEVRNILINTAIDMGAGGFDNNFGFGRVNAFAAVEQAINQTATLSGLSYLCNNQPRTVNLTNQLGANVTWSSSSSNVKIIASNNQSATVEPRFSTSSGNGFVRANLGNGIIRTTNFWVGPASYPSHTTGQVYVQGYYGQNSLTLASDGLYTFQATGGHGNSGYTWHLPSGFSFNGSSTGSVVQIWTSSNGGNYTLVVRPVNPCGSEGGTRTLSIYIPSFGGGIEPDPNCPNPPCQIPHSNNISSSEQEEIVYVNAQKRLVLIGYDENATVQVYTINGKQILNSKHSNNINLYGLNSGIYIIIVLEGQEIKRKRIILN